MAVTNAIVGKSFGVGGSTIGKSCQRITAWGWRGRDVMEPMPALALRYPATAGSPAERAAASGVPVAAASRAASSASATQITPRCVNACG